MSKHSCQMLIQVPMYIYLIGTTSLVDLRTTQYRSTTKLSALKNMPKRRGDSLRSKKERQVQRNNGKEKILADQRKLSKRIEKTHPHSQVRLMRKIMKKRTFVSTKLLILIFIQLMPPNPQPTLTMRSLMKSRAKMRT